MTGAGKERTPNVCQRLQMGELVQGESVTISAVLEVRDRWRTGQPDHKVHVIAYGRRIRGVRFVSESRVCLTVYDEPKRIRW